MLLPSSIALLGLTLAAPGLVQQTLASPRDRIEALVWSELASSSDGRAYVIVFLGELSDAQIREELPRQAEVDARQDQVLAAVTTEEFEVVYRYANVAALTGRANAQALDVLSVHPLVHWIGIDRPVSGATSSSVPFIGADRVQSELGIDGTGVTVAVLDSGIDTDHVDLMDSIAPGGMSFLNQGATVGTNIEDGDGHGTNVSGIITSNGVVAPVGVAPGADILVVRVLDNSGNGWLSDTTAGIDYVVSVQDDYAQLSVINMSIAGSTTYSQCPCDSQTVANTALGQASRAARDAGIELFASQGNTGQCRFMAVPACLAAVHAVAAVYDLFSPDHITDFTSQSDCNDLAAPGSSITSTGLGGGTSNFTGTSQASPHVAGVAALMSEVRPAKKQRQTLLPAILRLTGVPTIKDACFPRPTSLRVDAFEAVRMASGLGRPPTSNRPAGPPASYGAASLQRIGPWAAGEVTRLRIAGTPQEDFVVLARTARGEELGAVATGALSDIGVAIVELDLGRVPCPLVFTALIGGQRRERSPDLALPASF